jgi:hypothetical protein
MFDVVHNTSSFFFYLKTNSIEVVPVLPAGTLVYMSDVYLFIT